MKEQTALQKGVTPKNGERAELKKLKKNVKREKKIFEILFNHVFLPEEGIASRRAGVTVAFNLIWVLVT